MKVQIELLNGYSFIVDIPESTKLSKNFTLGELANNKGAKAQPQFVLNRDVDIFISLLQDFRLWYNKPMKINSGYRQEMYNQIIGGVKNSLHLKGLAVDWGVSEFTDTQYMNCADEWKTLCTRKGVVGEINFYSSWIHLGAFADKNGYRSFQCRDYRNPSGGKKYTLIAL